MSPEQWQQVREVLAQALELRPPERPAFLDRACADTPWLRREVESLIRSHDDASTFVDRPVVRLAEADTAPARVGPYRLLEPLGEGGMGTVYLAERDDAYRQQVAVKLLRPGLGGDELLRRFRSERQILARLEHPHVARLLDGGSTDDGRPYLVMEHVRGVPLDRYCDEHRLPVRRRLELFLQVCAAIQFAHQNLVVHRDLKPGNILVSDDGEPKLLDFGIAKILRPEAFPQTLLPTDPGAVPLTPEYASPEQVQGGAITTASDVYSLGVLLYELLTGHRPYRFPGRHLAEIVRRVCHEEPARPSSVVARSEARDDGTTIDPETLASLRACEPRQLRRRLAGDLDRIVAKALAKDPRRRYASAEQLADDVRRHLDGRPVRARRATAGYRLAKLVGRHRWATASALVVTAALVAFVTVLVLQQERLRFERNRAEEVSGFLTEVFEMPDPTRARGESVTARELLDRGARSITERFDDQPEVRAELMAVIGRTYAGLGLLDEAAGLLQGAVDIDRELARADARTARRLQSLAHVLTLSGDAERARAAAERSLELHRRLDPGPRPEVARSLVRLARLDAETGDFDAAEARYAEALEVARAAGEPETLAEVLDVYGRLQDERGRYADAERLFEEALAILRAEHGELHPRRALLLNDLASAVQKRDLDLAETYYRRAEALQRRLFDGPHHELASTLNNLGLLLYEQQRFDEAEPFYREALDIRRQVLGDSHPRVAQSLSHLADLELALGRDEAAEGLYHRAIDMSVRELGDDHAETARVRANLGSLLLRQGRVDEAGRLFERALPVTRRVFGERHFRVAVLLNNLGTVARRRGDAETARALFREALEILRESLGDDHLNVGYALFNHGLFLEEQGDHAAAAEALRAAVRRCARHLGDDKPTVAKMKARLAVLEHGLGAGDEARRLARQAWRVLREAEPDGYWTERARQLAVP